MKLKIRLRKMNISELWDLETAYAEACADWSRAGNLDGAIRYAIKHTEVVIKLKALGEDALTLIEQENK